MDSRARALGFLLLGYGLGSINTAELMYPIAQFSILLILSAGLGLIYLNSDFGEMVNEKFRKKTSAEKDFDFFIDADLSEYEGGCIAIKDKKVIAHGKTWGELLKKVGRNSGALFTWVPKKGEIRI